MIISFWTFAILCALFIETRGIPYHGITCYETSCTLNSLAVSRVCRDPLLCSRSKNFHILRHYLVSAGIPKDGVVKLLNLLNLHARRLSADIGQSELRVGSMDLILFCLDYTVTFLFDLFSIGSLLNSQLAVT